MNYYAARELLHKPGVFHFTRRNGDDISAVGYCGTACLGHATKEEACAHFRKYILDRKVQYSKQLQRQEKCKKCGAWTTGMVLIDGYTVYPMCPEHQNRESLEEVYPEVHEIMSSS